MPGAARGATLLAGAYEHLESPSVRVSLLDFYASALRLWEEDEVGKEEGFYTHEQRESHEVYCALISQHLGDYLEGEGATEEAFSAALEEAAVEEEEKDGGRGEEGGRDDVKYFLGMYVFEPVFVRLMRGEVEKAGSAAARDMDLW